MTLDIKKFLMAGTALVAVSCFSAQAHAAPCADPTGGANCELSADPGSTLDVTDGDTVTIDTGFTLTQDIVSVTGGSAGTGIITTDGSGITLVQQGNIGTNPNELATVTVAANDTWTASGNITLNNAVNVDGNFNIDAPATNVAITATNGIEIGATGVLDVQDSTTGTVTLGGTTGTNGIDIATGGILRLTDVDGLTLGDVDGNAAGQGTVEVLESFTLGNTIGAANAVANVSIGNGTDATTLTAAQAVSATNVTINNNSALTTGADVTVTDNIDFAGATGTLTIGDGHDIITGGVDNTSGTANQGDIIFNDTAAGPDTVSNIAGNVGATAAVNSITVAADGTAQFGGTVNANSIAITTTGTADFDGTGAVNGNITMNGDGTADFAAAVTTYTGNIVNATGTAAQGTATFDTNNIVGTVGGTGTATLKQVNLNGAGAIDFSSTVGAADITFGGAATTTFNGDVTVTNDIDFNNNAGTINFADNVNFTGDITDTTNNNAGNVAFTGTSTVTGNIGTSGADDINNVAFNGGTGELVRLIGTLFNNGNITIGGAGTVTAEQQVTTVGDLAFTADGIVNFADGLVNIGGNVTTANDGEGTINFAGSATIGGNLGAEGFELNAVNVLGTGETVTVSGNADAADTTNLGANTLAVTGTFDVDAGQTIATSLSSSTTMGQATAGGAATIDTGALVSITVPNAAGYVADGQAFTIVDGTGGTGVADLAAGNITDNSFILNFTQVTANDEDLVVTANRTTLDTAATGSNNTSVGTVLEALQNAGDDGLDQIQASVSAATTQAELDERLESLTPTVDGGATVAAGFNTSTQALDIASTQIASVRNGTTGVAAGNMPKGVRTWFQGFGKISEQDQRDGVAGYEADTYGVAVGVDTENMNDRMVVGAAFSYANTEVDSNNANRTQSDVDSYQITLYGDYDIDDRTYVEGALGFAHNDIDQTRTNIGGIAGNTGTADFDSQQYIARAKLARDYSAGGDAIITPHAMAHYQHISIDDYTETTSVGGALSTDNDDLNIFELGVGAQVRWEIQNPGGSMTIPALHAGVRHDLIGDEVEATSTFTGGGTSFRTQGADPAQTTLNVGGSLTIMEANGWEFTGAYDFEYKSDFDAHSGYLRAGYKF